VVVHGQPKMQHHTRHPLREQPRSSQGRSSGSVPGVRVGENVTQQTRTAYQPGVVGLQVTVNPPTRDAHTVDCPGRSGVVLGFKGT
jgi:hypothetical protein